MPGQCCSGENQTKMSNQNLFGKVVPRNCKVYVSNQCANFYAAWSAGLINFFNGDYITDRITAKRMNLKIAGYNVR
jgi:hypothetical protein